MQIFTLTPHPGKTRTLWCVGLGEVVVQRVRVTRHPWWCVWELRAEVEVWRFPNGRLVEARRHALDVWTLQECAEDFQERAQGQPELPLMLSRSTSTSRRCACTPDSAPARPGPAPLCPPAQRSARLSGWASVTGRATAWSVLTAYTVPYEIQVDRHLDAGHSAWLGQLTLSPEFRRGRPVTSLRNALADQSALYGVLSMLQTMGVVLREVIRLQDPK